MSKAKRHRSLFVAAVTALALVFTFYAQPLLACSGGAFQSGGQGQRLSNNASTADKACAESECALFGAKDLLTQDRAETSTSASSSQPIVPAYGISYASAASSVGAVAAVSPERPTHDVYLLNGILRR